MIDKATPIGIPISIGMSGKGGGGGGSAGSGGGDEGGGGDDIFM
jgi:hypothetical protein